MKAPPQSRKPYTKADADASGSFRRLKCYHVPKIKLRLLIEPAFSGRIERNGKSHGHLGTYGSPAVQNGGKRLAADA